MTHPQLFITFTFQTNALATIVPMEIRHGEAPTVPKGHVH
jgi:hypothetical protein